MAFKDITKCLYPNKQGQHTIKLEYKDASHRYYIRRRKSFELPEDNPKAWGKAERPKGTTTLLGDTLEKKGLMTWPLGMALTELFGYYNFIGDNGERLQGFSEEKVLNEKNGELVKTGKLKGTIFGDDRNIKTLNHDQLYELVDSAAHAYIRRQKKGADIGSVVHDAIEHYVRKQDGQDVEPFDIREAYTELLNNSEYRTQGDKDEALANLDSDVASAELAFSRFVEWWNKVSPKLVGAEEIVYSLKYHVSGTFDGLIRFGDKLVLADWKTSNASKSLDAAMPEGINYQYYIQSAIYALIWEEMDGEPIDDLLIVSCRKDGGFTALFASELGLDIESLKNWVRAVFICNRMAEKTKGGLLQRGYDLGVLRDPKAKKEEK